MADQGTPGIGARTALREIVLGGRDIPACSCDWSTECAVYDWNDEEMCVKAIVAFLTWAAPDHPASPEVSAAAAIVDVGE